MRLTIPVTGTVLIEKPFAIGKNSDPIRPLDIGLGHVSWTMVELDLENEKMVIEVTPSDEIDEDTGKSDAKGFHIYRQRPTTIEEKKSYLRYAKELIEKHTTDELYIMSKNHRLKKPTHSK